MNSLNLYHIFYIAAQYGNITLAAKKLYISQPAVSKAISRLEDDLQSQLFVRSTRGVKLTVSGELLYQQLDTAFRAISQGEEQIRQNMQLGIGTLSVGVSTTLCKYVLLPYLQSFIRQNPHIRISISCQSTYETLDGLEKGVLDIGLVGKSEQMSGLIFRPLKQVTDILVASADYLDRLYERIGIDRTKEKAVLKELLSQGTLLMLNKNNITRQYVEKHLLLQDTTTGMVPFSVAAIDVSSMDLLVDFAKIGLGIACVIREFVESDLTAGSLIEIPLEKPIPSREIGFSYGADYQRNPAISKFLSLRN